MTLFSIRYLVTWRMPASAQNLRFEEKQLFSSLFQFKYMITEVKISYNEAPLHKIYLNMKSAKGAWM